MNLYLSSVIVALLVFRIRSGEWLHFLRFLYVFLAPVPHTRKDNCYNSVRSQKRYKKRFSATCLGVQTQTDFQSRSHLIFINRQQLLSQSENIFLYLPVE